MIFDEIAAWGDASSRFFCSGSRPFHFGIPCERWLRTAGQPRRPDPFSRAAVFEDWIKALWPGRHDPHRLLTGPLRQAQGEGRRGRTHDKGQGD